MEFTNIPYKHIFNGAQKTYEKALHDKGLKETTIHVTTTGRNQYYRKLKQRGKESCWGFSHFLFSVKTNIFLRSWENSEMQTIIKKVLWKHEASNSPMIISFFIIYLFIYFWFFNVDTFSSITIIKINSKLQNFIIF